MMYDEAEAYVQGICSECRYRYQDANREKCASCGNERLNFERGEPC